MISRRKFLAGLAASGAVVPVTRGGGRGLLLETAKNRYLPNGHNYQRPNLPCYLPGNGGLLYAVALMAGGWQGAPRTHAPGFPSDGTWTVRHEGLSYGLLRTF